MPLHIAVLLGLIQGLTEFLPVSSSGHLAVAQYFLPGFSQPGLLFDIVLHLGTLLAVLVYFRQEIVFMLRALGPGNEGTTWRQLWILLVVGTLPAVALVLLFGDLITESFSDLWIVGVTWMVTGVLLLSTARLTSNQRGFGDMKVTDALTVGLFQGAALLPGLSRSGSTIVGGLLRGLTHDAAARFSFLLSIPAIIGAAVYELPGVSLLETDAAAPYLAGFATAFLVGHVSIGFVLRLLAIRRFHLFGYYCLLAGGALLVYVASHLP
ncbi:MAG: undecaprenyl-diphosphate phosphatase [Vicinamibacteria bacterium]